MSLVIKKFEPGGKTTQPRLYKRGNDDIDLDAYIRDAESEFSYWLANSRLKDKEKQQVQEAYSRMIQGINDGTFTYKIGGGYNNSVGMSNQTKGFDAAGLAAGFLGNILRNQSVYKAPEEKPDPSKIEWKGNSSIGSALVRHLYGSDKESLNDFIDLDLPDPKTKKRENVNRSKRFKSGLEYIKNNFDKLFTSFTDSDKTTALERIDSALSAFDNGTIEDNEYLDLSRATGMSNLRDMFFAGEKYSSTTQAPETVTIPNAEDIYNNENELGITTYPISTVTNFINRALTTTANYKREGRIKLNSILMNMSKDNLLKLIRIGLKYSPTGQELNKGRSILQGFGQLTSFENNFIIRQALEAARRRNFLYLFPTDQNSYYIPFVSKKLDSRGTGFVYTINPNGNHTLLEMSRLDIPFFTDLLHNNFVTYVPSNKQGGTLQKFQEGGWFLKLYKQLTLADWNKNLSNVNWNLGTTFHGKANDLSSVALANSNYTSDYKAVGEDINTFVNSDLFNSNLSPEEIVQLYNQNAEKIRSFWDLNVSYNNTNASEHNRLFSKMFANRSNTTGGNNLYNLSYQLNLESLAGSQTWHRRMDRYEKNFFDLNDDEKKSRIHTITRIVNGVPLVFLVYKKENGDIAIFNDLTDVLSLIKLDIKQQIISPETSSKTSNPLTKLPNAEVKETSLPLPKTTLSRNYWYEALPAIVRTGRLFASLRANKNVYSTILPSLKPVLKEPEYRYSPVTGAFSLMLLSNKLGASTLFQANKPFTSDADLASARMFLGQAIANEHLTRGFLADDLEIKRTQKEALDRAEFSHHSRVDTANFNRASTNLSEREKALLKASWIKSNYNSVDNYLTETILNMANRFEELKLMSNSLRERIAADNASRWYNSVMEQADAEKDAYLKTTNINGRTPDITKWRKYSQYMRRRLLAENMRQAMLNREASAIYGLKYNSPYTDTAYSNFIKWI